jgi:hypothetical protein
MIITTNELKKAGYRCVRLKAMFEGPYYNSRPVDKFEIHAPDHRVITGERTTARAAWEAGRLFAEEYGIE